MSQIKLLRAAALFCEEFASVPLGPAYNILGLFLSLKDHRTDTALHGKEPLVEITVISNPYAGIPNGGGLFLRVIKARPVSSPRLFHALHHPLERRRPI